MDRKIALQIHANEHFEKVATLAAECGFKYVSMAFGEIESLSGENWKDYVLYIKNFLHSLGLKTVMTHAPYYSLIISAEILDPIMEEGLLRAIEATKMLGAEVCATHARSYFVNGELTDSSVDERESLRVNLENYRPLVEAAEKHGVLVGVENLMRYSSWRVPFYSYQVKDQIELIDKLNSPNVCAIWDFGHANLIDKGYDQAESIKALGKRIRGTHVHNNDGRQDFHLPPFVPAKSANAERVVDWKKTLKEFKNFGYTDYLTQEPSWNFEGPLKPYIQLIYDSLVMLDDMLHGEKK